MTANHADQNEPEGIAAGRGIAEHVLSTFATSEEKIPSHLAVAHSLMWWHERAVALVAALEAAEESARIRGIHLEQWERAYADEKEKRVGAEQRAEQAERERDEERERFHRHVETMIEPELLARADTLTQALRQIADYGHEMDDYDLPPKQARKIARAALAASQGTQEETSG